MAETEAVTAESTAAKPKEASLWRDRNFSTFWAGQALGQFGAQLGQLAFPVLAVTMLSASEVQVGVLNAAGLAAFLAVGLPAGAWVDRWLKRKTMITAELVRMAAMAVVPVLWWSGNLQIWHLYLIAAAAGTATVFFDVAYQSYVPVLVDSRLVREANSKLEATAQIARIGGPAAGGWLLALVSAPVLFVGESAGYLLSALFLARTRDAEVRTPAAGRRPLAAEIREGLQFVVRHPLISRIAACTGGMNFSGMLIFTLMPLLVLRSLGLGPQGMGLIMAVGAAGGLLGAVAAPRLAAADRRGHSDSRVRRGQLGIPAPGAALGNCLRVRSLAGPAAGLGIRVWLQRPRVQHRAAQHAPARLSAPAARPHERVHPVCGVGRDAAGCPRVGISW